MSRSRPAASPDERLLREALVVVRAARERAPSDFLIALAVALGGLVLGLVGVGLVVGGTVRDLCLDLAIEVAGAWLTVVLIDGLWTRQQAGTADRLRLMETRLQARLAEPRGLTATDREAWTAFVAAFRDLTARATVLDRLRAARGFGRRARQLEQRAEALLEIE